MWVVHSDHASILHRYVDMAPQILDARMWTRKERRNKGKRKWKEKAKGMEKVKGKGKGRWKEDSLRKVGRTDGRTYARTHGHSDDFIVCPMLCIALNRQ